MSSAPPAHQSKPSPHRRQHHNLGPRSPPPPPPQSQRYVPKSAPAAAPKPSPPSQPSLTTALRSSAASPSSSGSGGSSSGSVGVRSVDAFVAYLPHDEAVAAGLGGLDAHESQVVVDHLNDALAALLRAKPREFWLRGKRNILLCIACLSNLLLLALV
jgi:activating signal cointegrator complex subunit 2